MNLEINEHTHKTENRWKVVLAPPHSERFSADRSEAVPQL